MGRAGYGPGDNITMIKIYNTQDLYVRNPSHDALHLHCMLGLITVLLLVCNPIVPKQIDPLQMNSSCISLRAQQDSDILPKGILGLKYE